MRDHETPRQGFPLVLPKPFGFEEAVRRGRAIRRRRTAGAGAGAMTVVLGVLGALVLHGGPSDENLNFTEHDQSVEQRQEHSREWSTRGLPPPSSAPPAAAAGAGSRVGYGASGSDAVGGYVRQDGTPPTQLPDAPPPPTSGPTVNKPVMRQHEATDPEPDACAPVINPPERGWCTRMAVAATESVATFTFTVCRDISQQTPGGLTYHTPQRADFTVRDSRGTVVWTWSEGQRFASVESYSVTVQPGYCVSWDLDWQLVDERNRPVTSGQYTVYGWSEADGFETRSPDSRELTI